MAVVGARFCDPEERVFTVRKNMFPGEVFAAYNSNGGLAFCALIYGRRGLAGGVASSDELALFGPAAGGPLLTVVRGVPSLRQRWEGFLGARADGDTPFFSARRCSNLGGAALGVIVKLLPPPLSSSPAAPEVIRVVGAFPRRCCRVLAAPRGAEWEEAELVAEIKRKEGRVVMDTEVFEVMVKPGFDAALVMGLVAVLDKIAGDEARAGFYLPFDGR